MKRCSIQADLGKWERFGATEDKQADNPLHPIGAHCHMNLTSSNLGQSIPAVSWHSALLRSALNPH
jgi:hypothetical protein